GGWPRRDGFEKDLTSLRILRDRFGYQRLIYLIYGITAKQQQKLCNRMASIEVRSSPDLSGIELWVRREEERIPRPVEWRPSNGPVGIGRPNLKTNGTRR